MKRHLACLSLISALCTAPAHADLTDALIWQAGGETHVWLAFEHQPSHVQVHPGEGLVLHVDGVQVPAPRQIDPAGVGPIADLMLSPEDQGARIHLTGRFSGGQAVVREGGVLLTLHNVQGNVTPARSVSSHRDGDDEAAATRSETPASSPAPAPSGGAPAAMPASASQDGGASSSPSQSASGPASPDPAQADSGDPATLTPDAEAEGPCGPTAARLAEAPWDLNLLASHADCLVSMGEPDNAISLYERVLAFDPRHFQAALGLARIRSDRGEHEAAAALFDFAASAARTDGQAVQARMAARRARELASGN